MRTSLTEKKSVFTNNKWTVEIESTEVLICRLVEGDYGLLVNSQHRLFAISLHVHQVPEVVVEWKRRFLLQHLDAVPDVKPELDNVSD